MDARLRMMTVTLALILGSAGSPRPCAAEASAMEEVLEILRGEGLIDAPTEERLLAKYAGEQERAASRTVDLLGGLEWYGDLRLRHETFAFDEDATGTEADNRYRGRYRARFGFTRDVGDGIRVGVRLATGTGDPRSTNVTLGGNADFGGDGIFFDRAFVDLSLVSSDGAKLDLVGGKVGNPYVWKNGKDFLVFDGDLNLEGVYLTSSYRLSEDSRVFATLGTFVVRENSANADPKLFGLQLGSETALGGVDLGFRVSGYEWRSLDARFITDAMSQGNLPSAYDSRARMGSTFLYAKLPGETWPMKLYGTAVRNFTADTATLSGIRVGEENDAYGAGVELGDSKKVLKLGAGWFHVEANSVVAQIYDSDLFDGKTNREGIIVYASRRVAKNTDLNLTFFDGEEIEDDGGAAGPFASSLGNADRQRLQADIVVKF